EGSLTVGTLVAFISLLASVNKDAYNLTKKVAPSLIGATGGLQRIEDLLGQRPQVVDVPGAHPLPRLAREIRFADVTFSYNGGQSQLDHVSLTIPAGETVAIVGPSGAGKSTILSLITRLYDVTAGAGPGHRGGDHRDPGTARAQADGAGRDAPAGGRPACRSHLRGRLRLRGRRGQAPRAPRSTRTVSRVVVEAAPQRARRFTATRWSRHMNLYFLLALRRSPSPNPILVETFAILRKRGFNIEVGMGQDLLLQLGHMAVTRDLYVLESHTALWLSLAEIIHARGGRLLNPFPACLAVQNKIVAVERMRAGGVPTPR